MTALIVEDNTLQSRVLDELLKEENITSTIAEDGMRALEVLEMQKVNIIISDVSMPVMDGLTFLKAVKKDDKLKDIPFVMYSSRPIESDMKLAYLFKVDKFVPEAGVRGVIPAVLEILKKHQ